uniref:Olfactory receptor C family, v1 n=1 Tax=Lepisosteus oculatus TaxID=7918 RepID=W5M4U0_LEPOC
SFDPRAFRWAQTMRLAIQEINDNPYLLPNVTLGYKIYDSCATHVAGQRAILTVLNGPSEVSSRMCSGAWPVKVIIGDSGSSQSIVVSRTLQPFRIPMISYFSTCSCLSDRREFPTFFRTIPNDNYQVKAITQLIKRFGWSWVAVVSEDDEYGRFALQGLMKEFKHIGVCLAYYEMIPKVYSRKRILEIIDVIKRSTAKVVITFSGEGELYPLLKEYAAQNITGIQWIASEAWVTASLFAASEFYPSLGGTFKIADVFNIIVRNQKKKKNQFTWFACVSVSESCTLLVREDESIKCCIMMDISKLQHYLQEVSFNSSGEEVNFDQNGDPIPSYDVINWQRAADGNIEFCTVGLYDASRGAGKELFIQEDGITWNGHPGKVPVSVCTESCRPGTRKSVRRGEPLCCFDCIPCDDGKTSNQTDSIECIPCPPNYWSNAAKTDCIPKEVEYLSYDEMGITLAVIALLGACLTIGVLVVFLHSRNTPIVRVNNSELSFFILLSLTLCFLCSVAFIGQPTYWSCMFRHTAFSVTFSMCISCILGKTLVVLAAFKATRPGSNVMKWFGPRQQRMIIFACTAVQVVTCTIWLIAAPPFPLKNTVYQRSRIILECSTGSDLAFWCVLGYIGVLACLCFVLAFLARKLPDNFNEAKYITFSMLIFCVVWLVFIPAYVSSPGKYTVAVEIFAILASSFGLLVCIFAPKCYIILLKPEKNTKHHLMGRV